MFAAGDDVSDGRDGSALAAQFLREVFGAALADSPGTERLVLFTLPDAVVYQFDNIPAAARKTVSLNGSRAVYFHIALHEGIENGGRGRIETARTVVGLFADIDARGPGRKKPPETLCPTVRHALLIVEEFERRYAPLKASMLIDSGYGCYPAILFREPFLIETDEHRARVKRLSLRFHHVLHGIACERGWPGAVDYCDLAKVLRLPGTTNLKDPADPRLVAVCRRCDARFDPTELEELLPDVQLDERRCRPVPVMTGLVLNQDAGRPADKFAALIENDPLFKRTWEHQRKDLNDQSLSGYDQALANRAVAAGWTDQEVANLIIVFRKEHGDADDLKKGLRRDYIQHTILKARGIAVGVDPDTPTGEEAVSPGFPLTDYGNAERLVKRHGNNIRHCHTPRQWLVWDGRRWRKDDTAEIERYAKETVRDMRCEAARLDDSEKRKALWKHADRSEQETRLEATVNLAASELGIPIRPEEMDADSFLLTCTNGTLDLRTGELRSHCRDDLITRLAPVEYDPSARLPLWEQFLDHVTNGQHELTAFLQRALGYSLTGDTREDKLFFIHGPAATGKSTFVEAVKSALGDYATTSDFEAFVKRRSPGGARNDIARLAGARMVVSVEVDEGMELAQGLVKLLVGSDTVAARFLYRESFEFRPTFKLWLCANHAPKVKDDDEAMWRRILRIPFDRVIPREQRDSKIRSTLRDTKLAGSAILAWAVKGCLDWQRHGLGVPAVVEDSTETYRWEMDPLRDFIADCCVLAPRAWATSAALLLAYQEYRKERGEKSALSGNEFWERLKARGCKRKSRETIDRGKRKAIRGWEGIGLLSQEKAER